MKRTISLIIALFIVITAFATVPFSAASFTDGDWEYTKYNSESTIYRYHGSDKNVSIPRALGGFYVRHIGDEAFKDCSSVKRITIPDTINSIGESAFENCSSLLTIEIPESVTSVGKAAFRNCSELYDVEWSENADTIDEYTFDGCIDLKDIRLPEGVEVINAYAFTDCAPLETIYMPSSYRGGSLAAFDDEIYYEEEDFMLFMVCAKGSKAEDFATECGYQPVYVNESGFLYTVASGSVDLVGYDGNEENVVIPSLIDGYPVSTLSGRKERGIFPETGVRSVVIPDTVTLVMNYTFYGCISLEQVILPDSVTLIGDFAFNNCSSLKFIDIPDSVIYIGNFAFNMCLSLMSVTLPNNIQKIGDCTFFQTALEEIIIPGSVTEICHAAFANCYNLKKIYIPSSVRVIGERAFAECISLSSVTIEDGVEDIGEDAFVATSSLESLTLPHSIKYIDYHAVGYDAVPDEDAVFDYDYAKSDNFILKGIIYSSAFTYALLNDMEFEAQDNPFKDVKTTDYFYNPVMTAIRFDITNGIDGMHFGPAGTCTRAQIVTFLWRSYGSPSYSNFENPFTDVKKGQYYYEAVMWAVGNGITTGTSETTFSPDAGCTRGQVVTFLYRSSPDKAVNSESNPFSDVKDGAYYFDAVLWAVENGITNGTSATTFSPDAKCTRGQIVTFIFRYRYEYFIDLMPSPYKSLR